MVDDPRRNLKWLEQQLLEEERPRNFYKEEDDLMQRVDALIADMDEEDIPAGNFSRKSAGARAEQSHIRQQFDPSAAVLTKTRRQLRKEARQQRKANVNRSIGGLVFLAVLECIGIMVLLGWWLQ